MIICKKNLGFMAQCKIICFNNTTKMNKKFQKQLYRNGTPRYWLMVFLSEDLLDIVCSVIFFPLFVWPSFIFWICHVSAAYIGHNRTALLYDIPKNYVLWLTNKIKLFYENLNWFLVLNVTNRLWRVLEKVLRT